MVRVLRETTKCTKPNCKGWCFTDVVVGGWDRSRPGGIPHCRDCNKRYPEPDVATKSRLAGAYGIRYTTTMAAAGGQQVGNQSPQGTRGQPIGSGQGGGSGICPTWASVAASSPGTIRKPPLQAGQGNLHRQAPGPWTPEQKLRRENEELKKKLAAKEEKSDSSKDPGPKSATPDGGQTDEVQKGYQELNRLKQTLGNLQKQERTAAEVDLYQRLVEEQEQKLQAAKDKREAEKPLSQQLVDARKQLEAAKAKQEAQKEACCKAKEAAKAAQKAAEEA